MKNIQSIFTHSFLLLALFSSVCGMEENFNLQDDGEIVNLTAAELTDQKEQQTLANLQLIEASKNNDTDGITKALGLGANINFQDNFGNTGFHYTTSHGLINKARAPFILHKADQSIKNKNGQSADDIANQQANEHLISGGIRLGKFMAPNVEISRDVMAVILSAESIEEREDGKIFLKMPQHKNNSDEN